MCLFPECIDALGMESGKISDSQISASSQRDGGHAASQGRLHFQETSRKSGAWVATYRNNHQWLQVDLGISNRIATVTGVATQGRHYSNEWPWGQHRQWVTKYRLQYSDDGLNFQCYREQGQTTDKVKIF